MSAVCAFAWPDPARVEGLVTSALARMRHYDWMRPVHRAEPGDTGGLGAVTMLPSDGRAIARHPQGDASLALYGELFDTHAELARLQAAGLVWAAESDMNLKTNLLTLASAGLR